MSELNKLIEITPQTMLEDFFNSYPQLEDNLIEIMPVYKRLKNPVLRKSVAKVTTLQQAAVIGNITLGELINKLREAAGLNEIVIETENKMANKPDWIIEDKIAVTYDASIDLEKGMHPVAKVTKEVLEITNDEIYLLITPFLPSPLLQKVEELGFIHFSEKVNENQVNNYFKRKV